MKISQLRYFSAACHYGSITKAANELHISQPAITAAIKALESELGVPLLLRSNRAVSMTPDGEHFLLRCDSILSDIDSLAEEYNALQERRKTIKVGIPPMIGSILFPEIFRSFRIKYPDIKIIPAEMGSQAARGAVIDGKLDLAVITMGEDAPTRLSAIQLTGYDMMYCVGLNHPLVDQESVSLTEAVKYPMIFFDGGYYQNVLLQSHFHALNLYPDVLFHCNQLTTIKSFIRNNLAAGFLMPPLVRQEDAIHAIHVEEGLHLNVAVIWRKDDYLTSEAKTFINFCRKTIVKHR